MGRLRREAIEPLRAGREAFFRVFDWERGALSSRKTHVSPSDLVVVEGVYSAAPVLADLVDRAIYVDTPEEERLARLAGRVAPGEWDGDWLAAERRVLRRLAPGGIVRSRDLRQRHWTDAAVKPARRAGDGARAFLRRDGIDGPARDGRCRPVTVRLE